MHAFCNVLFLDVAVFGVVMSNLPRSTVFRVSIHLPLAGRDVFTPPPPSLERVRVRSKDPQRDENKEGLTFTYHLSFIFKIIFVRTKRVFEILSYFYLCTVRTDGLLAETQPNFLKMYGESMYVVKMQGSSESGEGQVKFNFYVISWIELD